MFNKKVKIKKYFQLNMPYILGLKRSLNKFKRLKPYQMCSLKYGIKISSRKKF